MLAYYTKPVLALVPEAFDLIKEASITQSLPVDSEASVIASALAVAYAEQNNFKVDLYEMEKVAKAVQLYDLEATIRPLKEAMLKRAKVDAIASAMPAEDEYLRKEASFFGHTVEEKVETANALYKQASDLGLTPSEDVQRYSGHMVLNPQALQGCLTARYHLTNDVGFAKIATAVSTMDVLGMKPETVKDICDTVYKMDKQAGLLFRGFDIYKEALIKQSAISTVLAVKLCGKDVPYESIARVGKDRISHYIGDDVAKTLDSDPREAKAAIESLPLDIQQILSKLVSNV